MTSARRATSTILRPDALESEEPRDLVSIQGWAVARELPSRYPIGGKVMWKVSRKYLLAAAFAGVAALAVTQAQAQGPWSGPYFGLHAGYGWGHHYHS